MCGFELPIDDEGQVEPHDHPELVGGARVIRRIHSEFVIDDQNTGAKRLSSAVFKHSPKNGHLSFDSTVCIEAKGNDPADYVTTQRFFGALSLTVDELRSIDTAENNDSRWKLGMVPVEGNDCHAGLWGRVTKGQANQLQTLAGWLVEIAGVKKLGEA